MEDEVPNKGHQSQLNKFQASATSMLTIFNTVK